MSLFLTRLTLNIALLMVEIAGDRVQMLTELDYRLKAASDSATHGLVAGISWLLALEDGRQAWHPSHGGFFETILCFSFGCFIDIDHFIEARSIWLKDVMNLPRRPMFHSTTLLLLTITALTVLSLSSSSIYLHRINCILLVAWFSHQLRDGIRRGLWFPPFGSTRPLPYWMYLAATAVLPHAVRSLILQPGKPAHLPFII